MSSFFKTLFVVFLGLLLPTHAISSGCGEPIKIPVQIPSDKKCWFYSGVGTIFEIDANAGETVFVRMFDVAEQPLSPSAHGPNGFIQIQEMDAKTGNFDENGELEFRVPSTGKYEIMLGPCAVWGESIKAQICRK